MSGSTGHVAGDREGAAAGPAVVVTLPDLSAQESGPGGEPLRVVYLLGAPMRVWGRSSMHTTELVREFSLLMIGRASSADTGDEGQVGGDQGQGPPGGRASANVPQRLVQLASDLQARYAGITDAQQNELEEALAAGELTRDFTYRVPASVGPACQQLLDLLEEADAYCQHGDLLTLISPVDQQEFRRWYLGEFSRQLAGRPPRPWQGPTT